MVAVWQRFLRACMPGLLVTTGALVGAGTVLMTAQAMTLSPVLPGLRGVLMVVLGYLPASLAVALPVGLLVGVVSAARGWLEGGEVLGLETCGVRPSALAWPVLALGLLAACAQGALSHGLEPLGRSQASAALHAATGDLRLRPEQSVLLGPLLLHVVDVDGPVFHDVFIAGPGVVGAARSGRLASGERLQLTEGMALADGGAGPEWSLSFARAEISLAQGSRRVELAERSTASLRSLIERMQASGRPAAAERLACLKRSLVPACLPVLALLALPLGLRGMQPGVAAVGVLLGWWSLMRVGDQAVDSLGPALAGGLPAGGLVLGLILGWVAWWRR